MHTPERSLSAKTGALLAAGSLALGVANPAEAKPEQPPEQPTSIEQAMAQTAETIGHTLIIHLPELKPLKPKRPKLPQILKFIGGCETNNSPYAKINYHAESPISTASGGFQFLDTTWNNYKGYSRAKYAPPRVQNKKAIITYRQLGTSPWYASQHCWEPAL